MQTSARIYFEFVAATFAMQNNGEVTITGSLEVILTDKYGEHWYYLCVLYELHGSQRLVCAVLNNVHSCVSDGFGQACFHVPVNTLSV